MSRDFSRNSFTSQRVTRYGNADFENFNRQHDELIDLLKGLVTYPNVKICLSSRPWPVFEDAFAQGPSLMLQDLTYSDILEFATHKLHQSTQFNYLKMQEPEYGSQLVFQIARKAARVFL